MPASDLKYSPVRCETPPLPLEAKLSAAGFAFASAMSSGTVFAVTEGCTTSRIVAEPSSVTGTKSRT